MSKLSNLLFVAVAVVFLAGCNRLKESGNITNQSNFSNQQEGEKNMETTFNISTELTMKVEEGAVVGREEGIKKEDIQTEDETDFNSRFNISDYSEIKVKEMDKEGEIDDRELGLYWRRPGIQDTFYTDVQELCEEAFGDYLSPLQGLTELYSSTADKYKKRFRTDKQTALVTRGKVQFYLFLPNEIAEVSITERDNTFYTEVKILSEEAAKSIKVLKLPPTGGIGIAGTDHKPEYPNYKTHSIVTKAMENEYTKADIQLVFYEDIQRLAKEVFGNYVQALQGLYALAEQEGYGGYFEIEDIVGYILTGHYETTVMKEDYFEFTMELQYPERARVTISRNGDNYITTFRLLKEGEFETEVQPGG